MPLFMYGCWVRVCIQTESPVDPWATKGCLCDFLNCGFDPWQGVKETPLTRSTMCYQHYFQSSFSNFHILVGVWFPSTSAFKGLHYRFAVSLHAMTPGVLML